MHCHLRKQIQIGKTLTTQEDIFIINLTTGVVQTLTRQPKGLRPFVTVEVSEVGHLLVVLENNLNYTFLSLF